LLFEFWHETGDTAHASQMGSLKHPELYQVIERIRIWQLFKRHLVVFW